MCGLIGGTSRLALDLSSISHRGPDSYGEAVQDCWRLGHTRLAIQDISDASAQPVVSSSLTVTYNGELWNPDRLRNMLGGAWATTGDTEVVVRMIEQHGTRALAQLDGMFALAWVDESGDLMLARDAHGEIPLHYGTTSDGQFMYCSEIAPLLAHGVQADSVRWVQPGTVLTVTPDGSRSSEQWFALPEDQPTASVRDLLRDGVRNREISDVPVAFLLSGGLDSAAVAALSSMKHRVAYTAVHHAKSRDRRLARQVAARLGMILIEVPVPSPSAADLGSVVQIIEQPHKAQIEIAWACVHLAKRMQADGIKVVLSGEGSDELLGSYGMAYHGIQKHGWRGYREQTFIGQHRKNFARTNKVFMRYGIEARLPFLHPPLVQHLLSRSQEEVTMHKRHAKAILASAVEDLVGSEVAWRPKAAFQTEARLDKAAARAVSDPAKFYRETYASHFGGAKP
jgi:asparagine synthase (glutamine-hydrolysing)